LSERLLKIVEKVFIPFCSGRDGAPCNATSPNTRMATLMQAACNTLVGDHFQPQSPVCTPQRINPIMMMDNFSVRISNYVIAQVCITKCIYLWCTEKMPVLLLIE